MNPNKLTAKSREALQWAIQQAENSGHAVVDIEHFGLALLQDSDGLVQDIVLQDSRVFCLCSLLCNNHLLLFHYIFHLLSAGIVTYIP